MKRILLAALLCALGAACDRQRTCPAGQTLCGDDCRDLAVDPLACGACGAACPSGEACNAGACTACALACGDGQRCEDGLCLADVYGACFSSGTVEGMNANLARAGLPLSTGSGPIAFATVGDRLYVANNTDNTISEIRFDPPVRATSGASAIRLFGPTGPFGTFDLQHVAARGGLLYVANAAASTLVVVEPAGAVRSEVPLAPAPGVSVNPRGVGFAGTKVYVALWDTDEVAVVDCPDGFCGAVAKRIPVAALAQDGGATGALAKPHRLATVGTRVFVTLNNLRPTAPFGFEPAGPGRIAVIDAATDALDPNPVVQLPPACESPSTMALQATTLWVACGHATFSTPPARGGALVAVDAASAPPTVGSATPIDGAPGSVALCSGSAWLGDVVSGSVFKVALDASLVQSAPLCSGDSAFVADVSCAP